MEKFISITSQAAPLPLVNIDTDMIIPKQFLKTITRTGLGKALFHELRTRPDGTLVPDFVLNQPRYAGAQILVAGANFGCGSSREHAPWALTDYGFRAIIAPSFADIFFNNCSKNGLLAVVLPPAQVDLCMAAATAGTPITIDLQQQQVTISGQTPMPFTLDEFRRHCLLNGLDDIGLTEQHADKITAYEAAQRQQQPWLWAH